MTETLALNPPARPPAQRWLRDTGYALAALPLAVVALVVVIALVAAGLGLSVIVGGLFVLAAGVYAARGFAYAERRRLATLTGRAVPEPAYLRAREGDGFWRRSLTPLRDPQSWLDVVWSLVGWITATVAFALVVAWWGAVLCGATYWFWQRFIPRDDSDAQSLADLIGLGDSRAADIGLITGIGLVALVTLPLALRCAAVVHASLASVLLTSRAELQGRVARVEESRDWAHRAEATSLRKLERDIHDGPQQRLIRLGMDLGRARVSATARRWSTRSWPSVPTSRSSTCGCRPATPTRGCGRRSRAGRCGRRRRCWCCPSTSWRRTPTSCWRRGRAASATCSRTG